LSAVLHPVYPLFYAQAWFEPPIPRSRSAVHVSQYVKQQQRACVSVIAASCHSYIVISEVSDPLEGYTQLLTHIPEDIAEYRVYRSRVYEAHGQIWWRYSLIHQEALDTLMRQMCRERLCLHHVMDKWHYLFSTLAPDGVQSITGWYLVSWQEQLHQLLVVDSHIVVQVDHAVPTQEAIIQCYKEAPLAVKSWYIGPLETYQDMVWSAAGRVQAHCEEVPWSVYSKRCAQSVCKLPYRHRYRLCCYGFFLSLMAGLTTLWLVVSFYTHAPATQPLSSPLSQATVTHLIQEVKALSHAMPAQTKIEALVFTEKHWQLTAAYRAAHQVKMIADRLGPAWHCHRRAGRAQVMCSRKPHDY
jgi:hypothetical protein